MPQATGKSTTVSSATQSDFIFLEPGEWVLMVTASGWGAAALQVGDGATFMNAQDSSGDIEGLPVWFEIDDINASVPLPWQAIDTERTTWADWGTFGDSHKPTKIGTKWYRSSAVGSSGQLLDASQFVGLGLTVLTRSQYLDILPSSPI